MVSRGTKMNYSIIFIRYGSKNETVKQTAFGYQREMILLYDGRRIFISLLMSLQSTYVVTTIYYYMTVAAEIGVESRK